MCLGRVGGPLLDILNRSMVTNLAAQSTPTTLTVGASSSVPVHATSNMFDLEGTNGVDVDINPTSNTITFSVDEINASQFDSGTSTYGNNELLMTGPSGSPNQILSVDDSAATSGFALRLTNTGPAWQNLTISNLNGVSVGTEATGDALIYDGTNYTNIPLLTAPTGGSAATYTFDLGVSTQGFSLTTFNLALNNAAGAPVDAAVTGGPTIGGADTATRAAQVVTQINSAISDAGISAVWVAATAASTGIGPVVQDSVVITRQMNGSITNRSGDFSILTAPVNQIGGPVFADGTDASRQLRPEFRTGGGGGDTFRLGEGIWKGSNGSPITVPSATTPTDQPVTLTADIDQNNVFATGTTNLPAGIYQIDAYLHLDLSLIHI